jgi:hypothetical protein
VSVSLPASTIRLQALHTLIYYGSKNFKNQTSTPILTCIEGSLFSNGECKKRQYFNPISLFLYKEKLIKPTVIRVMIVCC